MPQRFTSPPFLAPPAPTLVGCSSLLSQWMDCWSFFSLALLLPPPWGGEEVTYIKKKGGWERGGRRDSPATHISRARAVKIRLWCPIAHTRTPQATNGPYGRGGEEKQGWVAVTSIFFPQRPDTGWLNILIWQYVSKSGGGKRCVCCMCGWNFFVISFFKIPFFCDLSFSRKLLHCGR